MFHNIFNNSHVYIIHITRDSNIKMENKTLIKIKDITHSQPT